MDELIQNAERSYPMFTEKLKIMHDDEDLEGLMKTAKRRKGSSYTDTESSSYRGEKRSTGA